MRTRQGPSSIECVKNHARSAPSRRSKTRFWDAEIATLGVKGHMPAMTMFSFHMRFLRSAGILLNRR